MNLSAYDNSRGKNPGISGYFQALLAPVCQPFLTDYQDFSSVLEGIYGHQKSRLEMLSDAVAKNESSIRVLFAGIGRFPSVSVCVPSLMWSLAFIPPHPHSLVKTTYSQSKSLSKMNLPHIFFFCYWDTLVSTAHAKSDFCHFFKWI